MKYIFITFIALVIYGCTSKPQTAPAPPPPSLPVVTIVTGTDTTYQEYPAAVEGSINVEGAPAGKRRAG